MANKKSLSENRCLTALMSLRSYLTIPLQTKIDLFFGHYLKKNTKLLNKESDYMKY